MLSLGLRCALISGLLLYGCCSLALASTDPDDAAYYLYTNASPSVPKRIYTNDLKSLQTSLFNVALPTKIIIHGWTTSYNEIPNPQLRAAYQSRGPHNIISMDWSEIADMNYVMARPYVFGLGASCARFVRFLIKSAGLDPKRLVVIGHSMGAHIAGHCGKELQLLSDNKQRLGAIVALDAALPLFTYANKESRVADTDADFVVSLHTNAMFKGQIGPVGHADFYANGGANQPGCGVDPTGSCSHGRCVDLYAEAVQGVSTFEPYYTCADYFDLILSLGKCKALNGLVRLGDPLDVPQVKGIFTFETKDDSPYGPV
ncbi:pancreatic lipase-related protein 2-like [Scaptodrosophila lebanonensis]|uniref:Pancreatic lipase-related protein 2-like n=1 Tax=Drosophila lebanonensis TaxID=7225 RepID=A0A6J2TPN1_DROLE|nr:pancreatic lipase-related protein 2-like [Scaptodrosophila lebanonensis]